MRRPLALFLLLLSPVAALADDLRQWVPARELPGILERLRRDHHPHFAVVDYGQRSSEPRFLLFERRSHTLLGRFRVAHGVAGRSNGCLVLASADRDRVVRQLQGGALIFAIGPH